MYIVPPTSLSDSFSFPYVCARRPFKLETNWSEDIMDPTSRLFFLRFPSFVGLIVDLLTPSDCRTCFPSWHAWHLHCEVVTPLMLLVGSIFCLKRYWIHGILA